MSKKGIVGVAVLWLLIAVSSLSLSALSLGKRQEAMSRGHMQEVKALALATGAALLERDSNFDAAIRLREFSTGQVQIERQFLENKSEARLSCCVKCDGFEKEVEIGWRRIGGAWRAISWREL